MDITTFIAKALPEIEKLFFALENPSIIKILEAINIKIINKLYNEL